MKCIKLTISRARQIAVEAQFLNRNRDTCTGKEDILRIIDQLGYVQIDTISIINRSHHHTLWTRNPHYDETMLHELQAGDRAVFEYWGHAMSYLPMHDYRFNIRRMRNFENPSSPWAVMQFEKCRHLLKDVLKRIREEGPLCSRDFKPAKKGGTWWDWKPAKVALEMLLWRGDLMVTGRKNFQKVYDLTERVLPPHIDIRPPDDEELGRFIVGRAIRAFGVAGLKEMMNYLQPASSRDSDFRLAGRDVIEKAVHNMLESREIIPVRLENHSGCYYVSSKTLENRTDSKSAAPVLLHLLSPFDNLIIQRERTRHLFDFDYSLECYVAPSRRRYGYFVLPVLWGDTLAGRLDPKADRKTETMIIHNLVLEPEAVPPDVLIPALAKKLAEFSVFNGCKKIEIIRAVPDSVKKKLVKQSVGHMSSGKHHEKPQGTGQRL